MRADDRVDVVVLGAGPAGLAAGCAAADAGVEVLVLEAGQRAEQRDRDRPADLAQGVGGAGLHSDGKFSFAPSATALWVLEPRSLLEAAYAWTAKLLGEFGVLAPPFPEGPAPIVAGPVKAYPSQYMSPENRAALVTELAARLGSRLHADTPARLAESDDELAVTLADGTLIRAGALVLAGGRFGPLLEASTPIRFRRVELGVRVETPADRFPLDVPQTCWTLSGFGMTQTMGWSSGGHSAAAGGARSSRPSSPGYGMCPAAPTVQGPASRTSASMSDS